MTYFCDSYAIIEVVKGSPTYGRFKSFTVVTTVMNLAEVYYIWLSECGGAVADTLLASLSAQLLDISSKNAIEAAQLRYQRRKSKLSYIDCVGYAVARENGLRFLTGDQGFEHLDGVEFVK